MKGHAAQVGIAGFPGILYYPGKVKPLCTCPCNRFAIYCIIEELSVAVAGNPLPGNKIAQLNSHNIVDFEGSKIPNTCAN
jgi:hypothetical protein